MSSTKDQWIAHTGGFRLLETDEELRARVAEIQAIRGKATLTPADIERLAELAGLDHEEA